jgi:hypothetical protein
MKAVPLLLCLVWLSARAQEAPARSEDLQLQRITIQLRDAPQEHSYYVQRPGFEPLPLEDNGAAVLEVSIEAPPARSVQLTLRQDDPSYGTTLWHGLAMLGDRNQERIAFGYENDQGRVSAVRVAASPSLHPAAAGSASRAYLLAMGWGGLVLGYLGLLVVGWAVRSRGAPKP